jgi:hypothetical protein
VYRGFYSSSGHWGREQCVLRYYGTSGHGWTWETGVNVIAVIVGRRQQVPLKQWPACDVGGGLHWKSKLQWEAESGSQNISRRCGGG